MPEQIHLRDYQLASIEGLREGRRNGHRSQILMAPTGAGKSVIAAHLLAEANRKFSRAAFIVDRINLVDQTSALLDKYGIDHGIVQAGHWRFRPYERIQVCSAQTIEKRGFFPNLNLLIVDEAHSARKLTAELIKSRADLTVIGLTATPFTKGMASIYTNLVNVCTTNQLVSDKFLVPLTMYAAKAVDMTGAKVVAGEWAEKDIEQRGLQIIGDIVSEWTDKTLLHFGGPVKTIVFSATVEHGAELCRQFNVAGFNFQQISYKDGSDDTRRALIEEFRKPDSEIHGLVSCEVFTKGFDVPDILCGIAARPYRKSLSSHIQQMGRVMRTAPGKEFGLWLDHCGNVMRFKDDTDDIFQNGMKKLEDGDRDTKPRKEPSTREREDWSCTCGYVFARKMDACPACGKEKPHRALVESVAGVMEAVTGTKKAKLPDFLVDRDGVWGQLCNYGMDRKKGDVNAAEKFAYAQYISLYGTKPGKRFAVGEKITDELRGKVTNNLIRFIKGRQKGAQRV
jgi:superfamily II DNA or RNA helicase